MAKCKRCGKHGLFLKLSSFGFCESCEKELAVLRTKKEEEEAARLKEERQAELASIQLVDPKISEKPAKMGKASDGSAIAFTNITSRSNVEKLGNFVSLDCETTGLTPSKNEIIEFCAIRFRNWKPVERMDFLCCAEKGIPEDASKVNGITEDMVSGKPHFRNCAASVESFLGDDNLLGQNLEFDLKFLAKQGVDFLSRDRKYYDTLVIAKKRLKGPKSVFDKETETWSWELPEDYDVKEFSLGALCHYYSITIYDAHRAFDDALATAKLFHEMVKDIANS